MNEEEYSVGDSCPYSWLNEWLCEYVDGTMDPSLRRVFEKYVQANPELKAHIERLRHTRELLCRCSSAAAQEAPDALRARVQKQVECDMLRTPDSLHDAVRQHPMTAFASTLVVALVVGMFAGATLFGPDPVSTRSARAIEADHRAERSPVPQHAAMRDADLRGVPATMPRSTNAAPFYPMVEYDATGMPYVSALDSTSRMMTWSAAAAQP